MFVQTKPKLLFILCNFLRLKMNSRHIQSRNGNMQPRSMHCFFHKHKNCRRYETFNWLVADSLECRLGGRVLGWIRVLCSDVWPGITFYWTLITVPCFRWNSVAFLGAECLWSALNSAKCRIYPSHWVKLHLTEVYILDNFLTILYFPGLQNSDVPRWWGLEWEDWWIQENQSWPQEQSFKTQGWQWSSEASGSWLVLLKPHLYFNIILSGWGEIYRAWGNAGEVAPVGKDIWWRKWSQEDRDHQQQTTSRWRTQPTPWPRA